MSKLHQARLLAFDKHKGQFRRDGVTPYIEHVKRVAQRVRKKHNCEKTETVAWLHDILEDTDVTAKDLLNLEFDVEIVSAVVALTKKDGIVYYNYIYNINSNPLAKKVKIQDILDNLSDDPTNYQIKKYSKALLILCN